MFAEYRDIHELHMRGVTDDGLRQLRNLFRLDVLDLAGCEQIGDWGVLGIPGLASIQSINLIGTGIGDRTIQKLCDSTELKEVYAGSTNVTGRHMSGLRRLTILSLSHAPMINDDSLIEIVKIPQINYLNLGGCQITDVGAERLSQCQRVVDLRLSHTDISDKGLAFVSKMKTIRRLDLADTGISDDGLAQLVTLTNLEELDLGATKVSDRCADSLINLKSLRTLWINGSLFTPHGRSGFRAQRPQVKVDPTASIGDGGQLAR